MAVPGFLAGVGRANNANNVNNANNAYGVASGNVSKKLLVGSDDFAKTYDGTAENLVV